MKKLILIITSILFALSLTGCATTTKTTAPRERDETFIADIDSFEVESFNLLTAKKNNKTKVTQVNITFSPRTNNLFIDTKVGMNYIRIVLPYQERSAILEAHNKYLEQYDSNTIKNEKPSKKNAYSNGFSKIQWGTLGYAHSANAEYITNAYYLEPDKPYFRISFLQQESEKEKGTYSPITNIFISPAQWEKIYDVCKQEHLVQLVDDILMEAAEF